MIHSHEIDIGKKKTNNDDSVGALTFNDEHKDDGRSAGVFVLADGAGGYDSGDIASYIATTRVPELLSEELFSLAQNDTSEFSGLEFTRERLLDKKSDEEILDSISEAIKTASKDIATSPDLNQAMTTIVAGVYNNGSLYLGWVGDSRAYVLNDSWEKIELLTRDHSYVEELRLQGEVGEVEAMVHKDGNKITKAAGAGSSSQVEVDTRVVDVYGDDIVLLASDGLIDAYKNPDLHNKLLNADDREEVRQEILEKVVTDEDIRDIVLGADSLNAASSELIEFANRKGGADNISVSLFRDPSLPEAPVDAPIRDIDGKRVEELETKNLPQSVYEETIKIEKDPE